MLFVNMEIGIDDPRREDIRALLAIHLAFSRGATPVEYSFALDLDELVDAKVTFFSARECGRLVGVAALKRLDDGHLELKSMHVAETDRGRGIGRALVEYLVMFAEQAGCRRVSLETGSTGEFVAARDLYAKCGFAPCEPFAGYAASAYNTFMAITLVATPANGRLTVPNRPPVR
jgi:putative acetyltransferase